MLVVVCSSDAPEDPTKALLAQAEHLINEISDLAVILLKETGSDLEDEVTTAKHIKLTLSGLCGVFENKESATVDLNTLPIDLHTMSVEQRSMVTLLVRFAQDNNIEKPLSKQELISLFPPDFRHFLEIMQCEDTVYALYNKMNCLAKVVRQIRERT